ncbi:MAG: MATE family efflux transporter [Chitinophagaceae bacterium]|nr:MATE family efflux transporter [Chitinophagaceae bacterium]
MKNESFNTIRLAVPIIIGELAQMMLHIIDSAMVGAISYKHLAATSLVISTLNIPLVLGIGMTISVAQMVSMAHGQNDSAKVSHYFYNGFWLCAVTAIIISLSLVFGRNILYHLGQDRDVVELSLPFMTLMGLSMIPMLLFMTLKQFADGLQYTRTAMLLSLCALPVNIFLNWLLIYGNLGFPRLELVGAGWATLITRTLIFIVLGIIILRHKTFSEFMSLRYTEWKYNASTMRSLLKIGVPSSLQVAMEAGAFAITGILIGTMGAVSQAAHQIALGCAALTFMVSMGLSQAGSIRTSNAFGAGDWPKISLIGKSTLLTGVIYGVICAVMFIVFRNVLPTLFNENAEVIALASVLLLLAGIFQISDATQVIGAGLLRGIKDVKIPTYLVAVAYWVIGLPSGCLFAFVFDMGAPGMWLGFIVGLTLAGVFLSVRFLKKVK